MIRSMTAFAAGERNTPWGTLGCELRAVNHRFLELGVRLPDDLRAVEPAMRETHFQRGFRAASSTSACACARRRQTKTRLQLNPARVAHLAAMGRNLQEHFPATAPWNWSICCSSRACCRANAADPAALHAEALSLLDEVLGAVHRRSRPRRRAILPTNILERVDAIARHAADARTLMPAIRAGQKQKLVKTASPICRSRWTRADSNRNW